MSRGRKLPESLNVEEVKGLLAQPNPRYPTGLRNLCMLKVMLQIGLRASEVLKLKSTDIDWRNGKLKVVEGKGKKDRILWLNEDCLDVVRLWKQKKPESDFFFCTLDGKKIGDRYLRTMVKRYAQKAGIPKDVHPHILRHTFATEFYRETKNIMMTQKALGHSNVSTTMIYTHIVDDELESAMKDFRRN